MTALAKAMAAWGEPLPDWIAALAGACDQAGQDAVAQQLGYSRTAVSLLVNGKYGRDQTKIQGAVRAALMRSVVECPVLGEIETTDCRAHQARPYTAANPTRVALYGECHGGCPHASERRAS